MMFIRLSRRSDFQTHNLTTLAVYISIGICTQSQKWEILDVLLTILSAMWTANVIQTKGIKYV